MLRFLFNFALWLIILPLSNISEAEVVNYEFDIDYRAINVTGKTITALVIDGNIRGPTIQANLDDTLRITFNNRMEVETSIHWHGVLLPNDQDGVPYLTTPPIAAGSSLTFEYPVTHTGTYWYHAHTGLQEQRGLYGALVFRDPDEIRKYDRELVLVLSDWTDEYPETVLRNLKRDADYYALKKDTVQSWQGVLKHGRQAIRNRLAGAWIRMGPMDLSDVGYDAFLVNGKQSMHNTEVKQGETLRLRIINASASSYFNVEFSGGDMLLIEADGVPVVETTIERLRLATAETYDVLIKVRAAKRYELRATAEDGSGHASYYLGTGEPVPVLPAAKPNLYLMGHGSHNHAHGGTTHSGSHAHMRHSSEYADLKAKQPTGFDTGPENQGNRPDANGQHGTIHLVVRQQNPDRGRQDQDKQRRNCAF